MNVRKILLVDDEEDIRIVGTIALADVGGWEVVVAASGKQAIELARSEQPDLVLLDVMMPGLDGPTTFAALRAQPETAEMPIVFITAKAQKKETARLLALGARGVIEKPFDPMTLSDDLRKLLEQ